MLKIAFDGKEFSSRSFLKQSYPGACGIAAVANMIRLLTGEKIGEREIVEYSREAPNLEEGVGELDLAIPAIRLGYSVEAHYDTSFEKAISRAPIIACVDEFDHWLVVTKHDGGIFLIDSSDGAKRLSKTSEPGLIKRWKNHEIFYSLKIA